MTNQSDLLGYKIDNQGGPQFTIDNRRNHLNSKYDMAVNCLKNKSNFAHKNEIYSRDQSNRTESNFTGSSQSKGSFKKYTKPLKIKQSQINKMSDLENTHTPLDFGSIHKSSVGNSGSKKGGK